MLEYYDRRAPEYDQWYMGTGLFAERDRPGWHEELRDLCAAVAALPAASTLDVACGTGFLTRHLRGVVTGLDQSAQMLEIARERIPGGRVVQGDAMPLPFEDGSFDRVFTGHFYGHLRAGERERFVAEVRCGWRGSWSWSTRTCGRITTPRRSRSERSTTAPCTGSTSATSPAPGWRRSWPAARCCTTATGS